MKSTRPARIGDTIKLDGSFDAWLCPCGNTPSATGFYPVNEHHDAVEPIPEHWTTGLYGCFQCGAIIDQSTLRVVAMAELKTLLRRAGLTRTA